jgi:serine/threonine protein kinase
MLVVATHLAAKNLHDRFQECQEAGLPGIPVEELLRHLRQAASALDYMNAELSIQHRDVKPENILLTRKGEVKVSDFGLAKVLDGNSGVINSESVGLSWAYAAPEVFRGSVSRWTDQYSLAMTYYKLRTGKLPFSTNLSPFQRMQVHSLGLFDLGDLSEAEQAVIARATSEEPERHYASCLEMVAKLEAACSLPSLPVSRPELRQSAPVEYDPSSDPFPQTRRDLPQPMAPPEIRGTLLPGTDQPLEQDVTTDESFTEPPAPPPDSPEVLFEDSERLEETGRGTLGGVSLPEPSHIGQPGREPSDWYQDGGNAPGWKPPSGSRTAPAQPTWKPPQKGHGTGKMPALRGKQTGGGRRLVIAAVVLIGLAVPALLLAKPSQDEKPSPSVWTDPVLTGLKYLPAILAGAAGILAVCLLARVRRREAKLGAVLAREPVTFKLSREDCQPRAALAREPGASSGTEKIEEKSASSTQTALPMQPESSEEVGAEGSGPSNGRGPNPRVTVARHGIHVTRRRRKHTAALACPRCHVRLSEAQVEERKLRGFDWIKCPVCEEQVATPVSRESLVETRRLQAKVEELEAIIQTMRVNANQAQPSPNGADDPLDILQTKIATGEFDTFLAHKFTDESTVAVLARELKRRGFHPWLAQEQVPPGVPFQEKIEEAIPKAKSAVIVFGPTGLGDFERLELNAAISQFVNNRKPVIPVLLPGVRKIPENMPLLEQFGFIRFEKHVEEPEALDRLVWGITQKRPPGIFKTT